MTAVNPWKSRRVARPPARILPTPRADWWQRGTAIGGIISVVLVGVGLYLTNNFNREQLNLQRDSTREQQALALKGQRADRFVAAVDQLGQEGKDKLSIRLGGIYALEALMKDSVEDEDTVIEVLCAFVRTHAAQPKEIPDLVPDSSADVVAAVTVLGRRPDPQNHRKIDFSDTLLGLSGANLSKAYLFDADLPDANLSGVNLSDANLFSADLYRVTLDGANLNNANLSEANLYGAHLRGVSIVDANLNDANLSGAYLSRATLTNANLSEADMGAADLTFANLSGVRLNRANLTYANLSGANLRSADLSTAVINSAQVACAFVDESTRLPGRVHRPASNAWESPECAKARDS